VRRKSIVNYPVRTWRPLLRVLAIALALAIPLPALAADGSQPAAKPGLRASITHAVASARLTASPGKTRATRDESQSTPDAKAQLASRSFFRTPAGVAVLAIVGAGAGYAVYSASHDRIHSVIRQGQ
jgi:hypothetical protein